MSLEGSQMSYIHTLINKLNIKALPKCSELRVMSCEQFC